MEISTVIQFHEIKRKTINMTKATERTTETPKPTVPTVSCSFFKNFFLKRAMSKTV